MRVLVTNDDGIAGPGLHALARRLAEDGHRVRVLAPEADCTGGSAGLGPMRFDEATVMRRVEMVGLEGIEAYALPAPPAMCVLAAFLGAFEELPEVVASGINAGPNVGAAVLHSGTVCAALTAIHFRSRAVAISHAALGRNDHWATAADLASSVVRWLSTAPFGTVLNLNVPATAPGVRPRVKLAGLAPFGTTLGIETRSVDERGRHLRWRYCPESVLDDTDTGLLQRGFATITPLRGVGAAAMEVSELVEALA